MEVIALAKIDLGCGKKKRPGCIGIDWSKNSDADIVRDLEKGLPFSDGTIHAIYASHVLEHLHDLSFVMNECWRVLRVGGIMEISVPHRDSPESDWDPSHVRRFAEETFLYYSDHPHWQEHRDLMDISASFAVRRLEKDGWQIIVTYEKTHE
jgi:predicted SAM-dependent methyltransferase